MSTTELSQLNAAELMKIRFAWETREPYQTDPRRWLELAQNFRRLGCLSNAAKCEQRAEYFKQTVMPL